MVKKDKATAAAAKKQRALLKTAKKGNKKTKKLNALADADEQDQDIDSILAEYQSKQAQRLVITEVPSDPPTTRINASLTPNPLKSELFLFGGEYFDGSLASFFNELYIYSVTKNSWTRNTSPNSPLPRSSHQAVVHKDQVWLFGGEFSSPKQNTFYHYGDFWSLDCTTRAWTKIETKPSPSARSGHRMASVGKYILLFGGFQDTSSETKYLSDLWAFDTDLYEWIEIKPPAVGQKPEARSGCVFAPGGAKDEAFLFGGYVTKKISGKLFKGVTLTDHWTLKMIGEPKTWVWVKRKRPASVPSPRVGAAIALHRSRLILFGGVFDTKEGEETLESTFYNDLHCLSLEASRWFPLKVRPPRKAPKRPAVDRKRDRDDRMDDLLENEKLLQRKMGENVDDVPAVDELMAEATDEVENVKLNDVELTMNMPHPRFNASMAVSGDSLFIYGGVYEAGEKEYSLNDMHMIDLAKLDGVRQLFGSVVAPIEESDSEEEDSDDDDDEEPEQKSVFYENIPEEPKEEEKVEEVDPDAPVDPRPMPKPFENMKAYFTRCATGWENYLLPWNQTASPKELRTKAFVRAEDYWWQVREQIRQEEDKMEDSGIGEVIEAAEGVAVREEKGVVGKRR